ncbi:glycoside hydrolase family 105 protein [Mucilaginibacter sp. L3T2-6]|uniref:glycoside hydrolase family 88/105 protein n=1 Tax=Mucilaginibacter sp. L3T2-6 TaxID=3062491 RepID=UPI002676BC3A|nr:glycoside hydrolase family 88 protein [Mucilaginibacter sp. L3T2-6]MDO3643313.1 glycoside hydrolase family 88 protein [Mucilaginibacter sp. L3T2-6]MDV6215754.1 glycoside hydrolase family 88 protein [Mucilaginibacter sp. L3T2-6]
MLLTKKSARRFLYFSLIILSVTTESAQAHSKKDSLLRRKTILKMMDKVADWQLNEWSSKGMRHPAYDWTNAACYTGLYAFGSMKGNERYLDTLVKIGTKLKWQTGPSRFMADDYCIGQTYSLLSVKYHDRKMMAPFMQLADSIAGKPHDESLEWKNNIAKREWAWCDALFMGPTALSYLSTATHDKKYLDIATKLWWKTTDYLYDPAEHLYFRDGSYLNKKEKNGKKVFWSRGNGWVLAGLVRVMENMPSNSPEKAKFEKLYREMASKIASLQQPDGSWHASLLDPASYPVKETSGTGFYCYALLWGLNHNLLAQATYWPVVKKAWAALASSVHANGMLGYVQRIGDSPDMVTAESTEVYGVGALLLTGEQLYKYVSKHPDAK